MGWDFGGITYKNSHPSVITITAEWSRDVGRWVGWREMVTDSSYDGERSEDKWKEEEDKKLKKKKKKGRVGGWERERGGREGRERERERE